MKLKQLPGTNIPEVDQNYSKQEYEDELAKLEGIYGTGLEVEITGPVDIIMLSEYSNADYGFPEEFKAETIISLEEGDSLKYPKTSSTLTNDDMLPIKVTTASKQEVFLAIWGEPCITGEGDTPYFSGNAGPLQKQLIAAMHSEYGEKVGLNSIFLSHV